MARRPATVHLIGCIGALAAALVLLNTLFPYLLKLYFLQPSRFAALRGEAFDYLLVALIPIVFWLVPPLVRGLARGTHALHKAVVGKSGFYVRFPTKRPVRFVDTAVRSLSPFAIDLLVIAELEYYLSVPGDALRRTLFTAPALLVLAAVLAAVTPGPWLVDALDLRLVNPAKGEVVRESDFFDLLLGPIGAVALLVSFVTLLHTAGYSYEQGATLLGLLAVRLFPPVLAAVSVYRIFIEPDVLPSLEQWADREGIEVKSSLEMTLRGLQPQAGSEAEPRRLADSPRPRR